MLPHIPPPLPLSFQDIDLRRIISLVGEANARLAEYSGLLQGIANPSLLLSPLMNEEAVLSSRIEGTQATVTEVLEFDAGIDLGEAKRQDIVEISNYRKAIVYSLESLNEKNPISLLFIRQLHAVLMQGVRGGDKNPGKFRVTQNWIGSPNRPIEEATYIPPPPFHLQGCLENLQTYLASDDFDPIVQTAIGHAQFEMIHPFADGNGRVGRLIIPLQLFLKSRIAFPTFYVSAYLEAHRTEYNERLANVSKANDWTGWIEFFLTAVTKQAFSNQSKVRKIMALYSESKDKIPQITRSQYGHKLVDSMFNMPIFKKSDLVNAGIPPQTINVLVNQLQKEGIISILKKGTGRTPNVYAFTNLLKLTA